MWKTKLYRFENLASYVYNSFIVKNSIIIFIGNNGTYLTAFKRNKSIDSIYIPLDDRNNTESYKYFFKKYKEFNIFFLHDDETCELKHELIPVLQSVVKVSPLEKFIDEHYQPNDITAHHIYNISTKNGEIWDTLIVKAPYEPPLSNLLNYILENSLKFSGIYFLNLEYITIINKILEKSKNTDYSDHLQIFAYITKANSIKFVVKHRQNIISIKSVTYPLDRTELYVQGIIEQEISDYKISFKNYIQRNNPSLCVICLVNNTLKSLLQESKFEIVKAVILSNEEVSESSISTNKEFSDKVITELFAKNKTFLAFNDSIKSITQVNLLNFIIFKPLLSIIIILIVILANIKFLTVKNTDAIKAFETQNYQIIEEYRNIKQKYPDIKDMANLADLYSLTALLKVPVITPFDFLEQFLKSNFADITLNKVSWRLNSPNNNLFTKNYINIAISFKYIRANLSVDETLSNLDLYIKSLRDNFKNFSIDYTTTSEPLNTLNRIIIPVTLTVTGLREL